MKAEYLIQLIEGYCKENNIDISEFYKRLGKEYQAEYGVNIALQMHENGGWDVTEYLEKLGIVERYVSILNRIKKGNNIN